MPEELLQVFRWRLFVVLFTVTLMDDLQPRDFRSMPLTVPALTVMV